MKYLLIAVLTLYTGACTAQPVAKPVTQQATPAPIPSEIDAACREFLAVRHPSTTVRGITIQRINDELYIAGADITVPEGRNEIYDLMIRRYDDRGHVYWKADDLSHSTVELLRNKEGK
jgi:hypothetical protein